MNMTGFEHGIRILKGLAYSYGVDIDFHCTGRLAIHKGGHSRDLTPDDISNDIAFEEAIKCFLKEYKEGTNGNSNKSECSDLSGMQSDDA